ncbi:MAG: BNR-4 repeat-containing protein [Thalassotalea sp.]
MKSLLLSFISILLINGCGSSDNTFTQDTTTPPIAEKLNTQDDTPVEIISSQVTKVANNHNISSDRGTGFGLYNDTANKTWVTWAGENMSAYVREYDHTNQTWSKSKIIGQIPNTTFFQYNWTQQKNDHHNYPKMTQMDDGRLIVIYSAHNSRLYKSISPNANTIDGWDANHYEEIKNGDKAIQATYPLVNKASNGDIFVFYRYTTGNPTDYRPLEMIKSTDNGLTFSQPVRVIDTNNALPENLNEVYNGGFRHEPAHGDIPERFLVGWTMAGGGPKNKHNLYHKNAYFAYFYPKTEKWTDAAGNDLGTSIDEHEIMNCLVFDSGELNSDHKHAVEYYFTASYTDEGNPVLLYIKRDKSGGHLTSARWTGNQWISVDVSTVNAGSNPIEISKTGEDDFIAYEMSGSKIFSYKTTDGAKTWSPENFIETDIQSLSKFGLIDNYHPDIKFLALQADWKERDTSGIYGVYVIKE